MSFDLDFLRRRGQATSFAEAVRWASERPLFKQTETALAYGNPETGVHFTFEANPPGTATTPVYPDGFEYAGFSFNINLVRPSFFAHEAMPQVVDLAASLNLMLFNPQSAGAITDGNIEGGLRASWSESNRVASIALRGESASPLHMPHEKAMTYWRYQKDRPRLAAQLEAQEIFVPSLFLFRRVGAAEVQTAVTWTPGVRMVVPPSDWSIIVRMKKSWLGAKQEVGYIGASELGGKLADYLEPFGGDGELLIVPAESIQSVERTLTRVELRSGLSAFTRVTVDEFTDVEAW